MTKTTEELLELAGLIEKHQEKLEMAFDFITFNHGEGTLDFTDYAFIHEDILITDPFLDTTARSVVNPLLYYGEDFTESKMAKMILDYCKWIS